MTAIPPARTIRTIGEPDSVEKTRVPLIRPEAYISLDTFFIDVHHLIRNCDLTNLHPNQYALVANLWVALMGQCESLRAAIEREERVGERVDVMNRMKRRLHARRQSIDAVGLYLAGISIRLDREGD